MLIEDVTYLEMNYPKKDFIVGGGDLSNMSGERKVQTFGTGNHEQSNQSFGNHINIQNESVSEIGHGFDPINSPSKLDESFANITPRVTGNKVEVGLDNSFNSSAINID